MPALLQDPSSVSQQAPNPTASVSQIKKTKQPSHRNEGVAWETLLSSSASCLPESLPPDSSRKPAINFLLQLDPGPSRAPFFFADRILTPSDLWFASLQPFYPKCRIEPNGLSSVEAQRQP
ncbi:hypothetical protein G6O67_001945 [Ophiocordyceps sinensis]|uniref:Uncharacterized protein n=1 Tax=Ophiocordyceps sinensis TaxID=72228 RepID=A0A8H4V6P9_9HYPO|nr:hypothetical protein G6O67_001945 [Ophiocordyceps sinensis]